MGEFLLRNVKKIIVKFMYCYVISCKRNAKLYKGQPTILSHFLTPKKIPHLPSYKQVGHYRALSYELASGQGTFTPAWYILRTFQLPAYAPLGWQMEELDAIKHSLVFPCTVNTKTLRLSSATACFVINAALPPSHKANCNIKLRVSVSSGGQDLHTIPISPT